jgi:hypothetical protein
MHKSLSGDGNRRVAIVHGLGGMGKTQLAAAYAKRYKDNYSAFFWMNAKDEYSLNQSFTKAARRILQEHPLASRLSSVNIQNLDEVVDGVKAWLSLPENNRWLVVYDNYDNPKLPGTADPSAVDVRQYIPESYQGSIIITTRSSQVKIGSRIQIRKLQDVRDSLKILSNACGQEGLENGKNILDS